MKPEELSQAITLLFENFWIVRESQPEEYMFLRRHQGFLQKEMKERFGMKLIMKNQYIQLLKRPLVLQDWMGNIGFTTQVDYVILCLAMAYVEGLEANRPFMLEELIREIELMKPERIDLDWSEYTHRKSLVRVIKKMLEFKVIETIQGETDDFEQSETQQEILFITTELARSFLSQAPKSYTQYNSFSDYWREMNENRYLEGNQKIFQQLMLTPYIQRTPDNEEEFVRLRNYHHHIAPYFDEKTTFHFELYRDYAALTVEQRESSDHIFPSRKVVDEIMIQLATICRNNQLEKSPYGVITLNKQEWYQLLDELQLEYKSYWSKEFSDKNIEKLSDSLLEKGQGWGLLNEDNEEIKINPTFSRLVAEMRNDDESMGN